MKTWWQRRTLRFRVTLWYSVFGFLLLAGSSAGLYLYVTNRMARPLDERLREDLAEIRQRLVIRSDGHLTWDGQEMAPAGHWEWNPANPWFELWDETGRLICRLWPFVDSQLEVLPAAPARGRETISIFNVARDLRLRVLSVPLEIPERESPWMIRVISIHEPAAGALGALRRSILLVVPSIILLLVGGGYLIMRYGIKPLDRMVAEANQITAKDLARRLSVTNPHDELGRLATVFNRTLDRLEESFAVLDRFVADASHELLTPLTALRSVGQVALHRERSQDDYRQTIASMLEESQRLEQLIQRLLELATAEGGASTIHRRPIRLDKYIDECLNDWGVLAELNSQRLLLEASPCEIATDPLLFRHALQNLVDNAIKYSPANSCIRVSIQETAKSCEVAVADEGPGLGAESQTHLAERFFRPDHSRARGPGGFGLGLSIAKAYMRVLGGTLAYRSAHPTGSIFVLSLPKPESPS